MLKQFIISEYKINSFRVNINCLCEKNLYINNQLFEKSELKNLIDYIILNEPKKKELIITLVKYNNYEFNDFLLDKIKFKKNIFFQYIKNIIHLVIFNQLDINIILYDLLLCYYLKNHLEKLDDKYFKTFSYKYSYNRINLNFTYEYEYIFLNNYIISENLEDRIEKIELDLQIEKNVNTTFLQRIDELEEIVHKLKPL